MPAVNLSAPRDLDAGCRPKYRLEIEGLRAFAVLSVILFHVDLKAFSGGYVGVDIFFVISGFLITRNILADIDSGLFTFSRFYLRRFRRLFPALAATLLLTLTTGFILFAPDDMALLGQSALYSVASLANFLFWSQAGYFDASATVKPLLHIWSLSVEEQFYFIWPTLIVCAYRLRKLRPLAVAVIVIGAVSYIVAEMVRPWDSGAVFYLMPFRMFELCTGAALAAIPMSRHPLWAQISMIVGLSLLTYSVMYFDSATSLRPLWALVPCIGVALVIYAGDAPWSSFLLSHRLSVAIGTISYSLYLVHWPIVVFYRYGQSAALGFAEQVLLVGLCFITAIAMYRLVERPFRTGAMERRLVGTRTAVLAFVFLAVGISAIGANAWYTNGWAFRLPLELRTIPSANTMWRERNSYVRVGQCFVYAPVNSFTDFDKDTCLKLESSKSNYLVVGDSLAADAYGALSAAYPNVNFLQATAGNCSPLNAFAADEICNALRKFIFAQFVRTTKIDGVVLSAAWRSDELDSLEATIDELKGRMVRVVLVGHGVRFSDNVPAIIFRSKSITKDGVEVNLNQNIKNGLVALNVAMRKRFREKVSFFIDIQSIMCEDQCTIFTPEGKMVYVDFAHLTVEGSRYLASRIASKYGNIFPSSRE